MLLRLRPHRLASLLLGVGICLGGCFSRPSVKLTNASPNGSIRFEEIAVESGLRYRWSLPGKPPHNILQTIGNGCGFLDYDADGRLDILLVGRDRIALYRGNGAGQFADRSEQAGLRGLRGHFLGCAVGDYDNDGFEDVYLSGYGTGRLLHNRKGKFFVDFTKAMGLPPQPWGTSCSFVDLDRDGFLDLFVGNYVRFGPESQQFCLVRGLPVTCGPGVYPKLRSAIYRNVGGKRFVDATRKWGIVTSGHTLGVAAADFDGSGFVDLAVANDALPGDLFQNKGRGRFVNIGASSGTAYARNGRRHAGMGIDWGDYDNDGRLDLFVTTFSAESKALYRNTGKGLFSEESATTGIEPILKQFVSFGCKFADFDNDGWSDLLIASGDVWDNPQAVIPGTQIRQPVKLLRNEAGPSGAGRNFTDVSGPAGLARLPGILGRGLSVGDFNNDGRMDALVVDNEGGPLILHNRSERAGNWLGIRLIGRRGNRNAYGAMVTVHAGGRALVRHCHADGSYVCASDSPLHFGLGDSKVIDELSIRWPSGSNTTLKRVPAGKYLTVREPADE